MPDLDSRKITELQAVDGRGWGEGPGVRDAG